MTTPDDQPPPKATSNQNIPKEVYEIVQKLTSKHDLGAYAIQLTAFHDSHLSEETDDLRQRLLLQGMDNDELHAIHEYLHVNFDGELMKMIDRDKSIDKAKNLQLHIEGEPCKL